MAGTQDWQRVRDMPKRFTESDKWRDKWFRALRPEYKLAWLYFLDNCDSAGVIDLDTELADFQLGIAPDWEEFFSKCDERIEQLHSGKFWVVRFIEYQYGTLSNDCRAHIPVFASLKKNGLLDRVLKGYSKGIQRDMDKDKDKDKEKDKDKDKETDKDRWEIPERLDTPSVRQLLDEFVVMRRKIGKPIKDVSSTSKVLRHFDDEGHLVYALETCIANQYQGLKPDYRPSSASAGSRNGVVTFAQQRVSNTKSAIERFAANG